MTEPTLPPKAEVPSFAATPDGYAGAYRRSRAIRLRRALAVGGTGTTLALVVAVGLLLPVGHGGSDQLVTTTPTATPSAAEPSATPSGAVPSPAAPTPSGSARGAQPTAGATPSGSSTPATGPSQGTGGGGEVGPPYQDVAFDATKGCNGAGPTPANGWCSYYDGATTARSGTNAVLATSVCRMPGQPTGTLVFGDGRQADFAVGPQSYPAVWTWSKGRRFATTSSTITVAPGRCVRWLVTWGVRDDGGAPLAPGSYYVDARPHEVQSGTYVTTDNPVTFTVTS